MPIQRTSLACLLLFIGSLLAACGSGGLVRTIEGKKNNSVLEAGTWGHLKSDRNSWLAQLPPGSAITICGDHQMETLAALRAWSNSVGRTGSFAFSVGCTPNVATKIKVVGSTRPEAKAHCADRKRGGSAFVSERAIILCMDKMLYPILLHETGHLWGMCDVYPAKLLPSDNCDPNWFTGRNSFSVMGASYTSNLSGADIEGVSKLTTRNDVAGNRLWNGGRSFAGDDDESGEEIKGPAVSAHGEVMSDELRQALEDLMSESGTQ